VFVLPYRQRADWGALEAAIGVLVNEDGTRRLLSPVRIEGTNITGRGWTVTVAASGRCALGLGPATTKAAS
jgi:hypothetical protein